MLFFKDSHLSTPYTFIKPCVKRGSMPTLEGIAKQLDGNSTHRTAYELKCYQAANERGWSLFSISWNRACNSGPDAVYTYMAQGSAYCYQGERVYAIPGKQLLTYLVSLITLQW